jgi:23S rRNA (adenine2030-N6)-methyltransferase
MNYRHAFHAGNFADVFKHALLSRILAYLMRKDAPLRYIDTHAGRGLYNLSEEEAQKTGEWRDGLGRLDAAAMTDEVRELLSPYLEAIGFANAPLLDYPGSPLIAQRLLRRQDKLIACELHPHEVRLLTKAVGRDRRMKVLAMDGYMGLNAFVPPPERRGLVLVDPPFESRDEFERLATALVAAYEKWQGGVYAAWYPVKDPVAVANFGSHLVEAGVQRVLRLELSVAAIEPDAPLAGTGLMVINPPFVLEEEARVLLPWLTAQMARSPDARWRVERLTKE